MAKLATLVGRREAQWIYEHARALGTDGAADRALLLARRRAAGEPLQYVLGTWPFRTLELEVGPAALIPRPETEQLVEQAIERWHRRRPGDGAALVVDLGTGTGAIGLSLVAELSVETAISLVATDLSIEALALARSNAEHLGIEATFSLGSWFEALDEGLAGTVDLLVANPPYVPLELASTLDPVLDHEPRLALYAPASSDGTPGFAALEIVLTGARHWLSPGGILALEMGEGQVDEAVALARGQGFVDIEAFSDLAGKPRGVVACAP